MRRDEGEDETLEVLDQVVKDAQPLGVLALLDLQDGEATQEACKDNGRCKLNCSKHFQYSYFH